MLIYDWILGNREIIKIIYGLAIVLICMIIVFKTHRLFKISFHQGIRYFRNAFFFFGIGFFIRYILGTNYIIYYSETYYRLFVYILFEFFLVMGGFFLLYSLLWKKLEKEDSFSSLMNSRILVFYAMTIIIVILDSLWQVYYFMFLSQVIIFISASIISYLNYIKDKKEHKFLRYYFIAMILSLVAWILNALLAFYLEWNKNILMGVYVINIIIFLLFLIGVIRFTKK